MEPVALILVLFASLVVSGVSWFTCFRRRRFFSYSCGLVQVVGGLMAGISTMILSDTSIGTFVDTATRSMSLGEVMACPAYLVSALMVLAGGVQAAGRGCLGLFCRYVDEDSSASWRG